MDSTTRTGTSIPSHFWGASWRGMSRWGLLLAAIMGVALGQSLYTFHYAEGLSYFSSNPKSCVNCHIMQPQYDGWQKASHHNFAKCVDCHLPHDLIGKYYTKAENGFWHSKGFTLQDFPEPIRMREVSRRVVQENCLHCHADFVHEILTIRADQEELDCIHCHRTVGHGDSVGVGRFEPVAAQLLKTEALLRKVEADGSRN
jgi:cytochrome c nitrite reductase small subunit